MAKRWIVPVALAAGWLLVGLLGMVTKQAGLFTLSGFLLIAAGVAAVVALVLGARERRAQREEELALLRQIAEQGKA